MIEWVGGIRPRITWWIAGMVGGIVSVPLSIGSCWASGAGNTFSISSLVFAGLAVPVVLIGTLLFESGTTDRFITGPVSALVVSSGVVAGVLVHQRRYAALVGFTGIVACLPILTGELALGVLGGLALLFGLVTGSVLLVYGIVFGHNPP